MSLILSGSDGLSDIDGSAATPAIRGTDANTGIFFPAADVTAISTSGTERMRIDSAGNLLVGTTTGALDKILSAYNGNLVNGIGLVDTSDVNGAFFVAFRNSSRTAIGSISRNGASAVSYNTSSDYRLKENIAPMTGALDKVQQLKPCTYKWKSDGSDGQGFIAHELQEVIDGCVTGEKDAVDAEGNPQYQGIDTSFLVATLTAAIQELKATVDAQSARIAALENPPVES